MGKSIEVLTNTFGCPNKFTATNDGTSIVEYSYSCICGKDNKINYAYGHIRFQFNKYHKLEAYGNLIE